MTKALRILIVEDDAIVCKALIHMLAKAFPDVKFIATPKVTEAWNLLVRTEFDLVMVDANLEDGYGADLVSTTRHAHAGVPFLGMSGDFECLKKLEQAGCQATLAKPFDLTELIETIALCLSAKEEPDANATRELAVDRGDGGGVLPAGSYTRPAA